MQACHNMNIIVQTTGVDISSLDGNSEISNKTWDNITRAFMVNSNHKKEFLSLVYQYMLYCCQVKLRIGYVMMLHTSYGMSQDHITNT